MVVKKVGEYGSLKHVAVVERRKRRRHGGASNLRRRGGGSPDPSPSWWWSAGPFAGVVVKKVGEELKMICL